MRELAVWREQAGRAGGAVNASTAVVPELPGGGIRLFDDPALTAIKLELRHAVEAPGVTHLDYRIARLARTSAAPGEGEHGAGDVPAPGLVGTWQ